MTVYLNWGCRVECIDDYDKKQKPTLPIRCAIFSMLHDRILGSAEREVFYNTKSGRVRPIILFDTILTKCPGFAQEWQRTTKILSLGRHSNSTRSETITESQLFPDLVILVYVQVLPGPLPSLSEEISTDQLLQQFFQPWRNPSRLIHERQDVQDQFCLWKCVCL